MTVDNPIGAVERAVIAALLDMHWPSLTDEAEDELIERQSHMSAVIFTGAPEDVDVADLALRYCRCGERIDGFDEFMVHLKKVFA